MKRAWLAATLLAASSATLAATTTFTATGTLDTSGLADSTLIEAWGQQGEYVNWSSGGASAFQPLADWLAGHAEQALQHLPRATAVFSYDPASAPISSTVIGERGFATYEVAGFSVALGGGGLPQQQFSSNASTALRRMGNHSDGVHVGHNGSTVDGPLPGSAMIDVGVTLSDVLFDLAELLQGDASFGFANVPSGLPVRLSWDGHISFTGMGVNFLRLRNGVPLDLSLPAAIDAASYDRGASIDVLADGVFKVGVLPADYMSFDDFLAARNWVQGNLRQVNVEWFGQWSVDGVSALGAPVPEPGTWALLLAGLALVPVAARGRQVSAPN